MRSDNHQICSPIADDRMTDCVDDLATEWASKGFFVPGVCIHTYEPGHDAAHIESVVAGLQDAECCDCFEADCTIV